jgi:alpha-tubulin suppressor-like RCC1 family protein
VSTGGAHACATLESGGIKCWGANGRGQLGLGDSEARGDEAGELGDALPRLDFGSSDRPIEVATGSGHTCVLFGRGWIKCFGANESGQLGVGDTQPRGDDADETGEALQVVDLGPDAAAIGVRAGHNHSCALLATGSVKCWGANEFGQLGLGDDRARGDEPDELGSNLSPADLGPSGMRAVDVSAGASHTCALLEDASVVCWGANSAGQLGTGDRATRGDTPSEGTLALMPVDLGSAPGAAQISVGANHACALSNERGVSCWGANLFGALGRGDQRLRGGTPEDVGSNLVALTFGHSDEGEPLRALAVSAGVDFSCVALHTGGVKCWGVNGQGQLGVGDAITRGDDPDELGDALPSVPFE